MQPFAELICAYLDGMPHADGILNDALEEAGRERVAAPGTASERLAIVLENLVSVSMSRRLSVDYARHVMKFLDSARAPTLLSHKEKAVATDPHGQELRTEQPFFDGELPPHAYVHLHELGWEEQPTPKSSAAWALWSALLVPVQHVASAAQRTLQDEVQWQIEHVKTLMME